MEGPVVAFKPIATTTKDCDSCQGTGKALASAAVAFEFLNQQGLWDDVDSLESREGGLVVVKYASSADLDKHGLRAVIERLTR